MAIRLTVTDQRIQDSTHFRGFVQPKVLIGRARVCDVCLPDLTVSSIHAEIRLEGGAYHILDPGSMNGTIIQGRRLIPHRPRKLQSGDVIEIAGYRIAFEQGTFPGCALGADESTRHAREMLRALLANSGRLNRPPTIIGLSGPGRGARCILGEKTPTAIIGRSRENAIRIDDPDVSRAHAELTLEDGAVLVRDLGSRNGIQHNGLRCDRFQLTPGNTFSVGTTVFGIENPVDPQLFAIQNAPEEDTSSFSALDEIIAGPPTQRSIDVSAYAEADDRKGNNPDEKPIAPPLPIGPRDPLLVEDAPRKTLPAPRGPVRVEDESTDMGLIVVGAIIVVASVAGLIWLFT